MRQSWWWLILGLFGSATPGPLLAQGQFTARVYDDVTRAPIRGHIEYEYDRGQWRPLGQARADGTFTAACPGPRNIRAYPHDYLEYRESDPHPCGGSVPLPLPRRELSQVLHNRLQNAGLIDRSQFGEAYANGALAEAVQTTNRSAAVELVARYLGNPERLDGGTRERAETIILNQTAAEFARVDTDRDSLISTSELQAAMVPN